MATISYTTTFDLANGVFEFEDTTDYVGQGIAEADVTGCFKIVTPSGVTYYNNTDFADGDATSGCDILIATSRDNKRVITLPTGTDDYPEAGGYTITYTVENSSTSDRYTQVNSYTYDYTSPEIEITQTTDCVAPQFVSTDSTVYTVNGVSPTSTVRSHVLQFPLGSGLSTITTSSSTITRGFEEFANGTQTTQVTTNLVYEFSDGLIIQDTVTGALECLVNCVDACVVYCCVNSIRQQMNTYQISNPALYLTTKELFDQIMSLVGFIMFARQCNRGTDISAVLSDIRTMGNCTDECSCSGTTPALVTGLGGLVNNVVVDSAGEPITVTPVTVGSTTTYTVSFNAAAWSKINDLYVVTVAAGTGIDSVGVATSGYNKTFTVNAAVPVLYNTTTAVATTSGIMTVLQSYTLAANKMATNGDVLEMYAEFDTNGTTERKAIDVRIGGTVAHSKVAEFTITAGEKASRLLVRATRQSTTTLFLQFWNVTSNGFYQTIGDGYLFYETGFSVSDLSVNTTLLQIRGRSLDATPSENINCTQFTVSLFKKS